MPPQLASVDIWLYCSWKCRNNTQEAPGRINTVPGVVSDVESDGSELHIIQEAAQIEEAPPTPPKRTTTPQKSGSRGTFV